MTMKLIGIKDTVLKRKIADSKTLTSDEKYNFTAGQELILTNWEPPVSSHLKINLDEPIDGKYEWFAFIEHVKIEVDDRIISFDTGKVGSLKLKNYTSCSTAGLKGLDRQLIAEINELSPNALVDFRDLNVNCGSGVWSFLQLPAKKALAKAIAARGKKIAINSAYRTIAQQQVLFNHYKAGKCGIQIAAQPPKSNHQSGLAIDIEDYSGWKPFLEQYGWKWLGESDRVHFDFVGGGTKDIRNLAVKAFQHVWNANNASDKIAVDGLFGNETEKRLNNSYVEGFGISFQEVRVLRLTEDLMQGDDVRQVQQKLIALGYSLGDEVSNGIYGVNTQNAIADFQEKDGNLVFDGIVGDLTRQKLGL